MRLRRPPRAAAVAIRTTDDTISYADVLKKARQEVSLGELGIKVTKIRRGLNGSIMIEIPGRDNSKAKMLADKLKEKLDEKEIIISRPTTMAEMMITGLHESVTKEEVADIITEYGECLAEEVKVGIIKRMYNGLGMIWARCPLRAANVMAKEEKIRIGWTIAKVELLPKRSAMV